MTMKNDDESELREAFAALRREDAEEAPPFQAMLASGAGHIRPIALAPGGWLAAAAVVAALLVGIWAVRRPAPTSPPMASMERWIAPTDFLLRTPGREILDSVPRLAEQPSLAVPSGATENGLPHMRRSTSP